MSRIPGLVVAASFLSAATFPLTHNLLVVKGLTARAHHLWDIHS